MRLENPASWPFFRENPDKVVLGPRPGTTPSTKPPVRIFLGTEDAQYRAERIFFYSIEKVRDPSRTYEIHLMKNVTGFDRRRWRTGFTNYRYAIPDFAGRQGKAIYNDVDQIYLADPALLFDLPMDGHGYLAISASDTSVMLIDCEKMLPLWNRAVASTGNKHTLLAKPKRTPGLWGELDPHWNARDQEYVEGRTKCLHYTALHQQPWEPFPELFSYHPNPLAYVWHELEREADAEGYQVFTAATPSPDFTARLQANSGRAPRRAAELPSAAARALLDDLGCRTMVRFTAPGQQGRLAATGPAAGIEVRGPGDLEGEQVDAVLVDGLLEEVPPADLGWLLDALFARARRFLHVAVDAASFEGLGSAGWWRRRLEIAARRHPEVSWLVDAVDPQSGLRPAGIRRGTPVATPRVWAIIADEPGDADVRALAAELGWPVTEKPAAAATAVGPWPDLVIAAGAKGGRAARQIKEVSQGHARLVQIGPPEASFRAFDLVVAAAGDRLPSRPNVLQVTAPLGHGRAERRRHRPSPAKARIFRLLRGGGKSYRGTPLQQHLPGRFLDALIARGLVTPPDDLETHSRALHARGLLDGQAEPMVMSPRPLNDLPRAAARVRELLRATPIGH